MIRRSETQVGQRGTSDRAHLEYVPGLLMVRIAEDVVATVPELVNSGLASIRRMVLPQSVHEPFFALQQHKQLQEVVPVFANAAVNVLKRVTSSVAGAFATSVRASESEDLRGINLLRLAPKTNLKEVERQLKRTPGVQYVHRVPARWIAARRTKPAAISHDPMVNRQWGLRAIRWFDANLPDARAVKVGVLDTGVDLTHPDLSGAVSSYQYGTASAEDIVGHGTHVTGIIGADPNNKLGISGVCPCDLHVWKIFGDFPDPDDGEYYVNELLYQRALNAARTSGMQVINLSIGGTAHSQTEEMLFKRLINHGCTVVAAMGNEAERGNPVEYPAAYSGVLAVGAINEANQHSSFSNTGPHIGLCAPGSNILSTLPMKKSAYRKASETKYAAWSGTSMATPHVTAAAAAVIAKQPGLSPKGVAKKLKSKASRLTEKKSGKSFSPMFGAGLLNLKRCFP